MELMKPEMTPRDRISAYARGQEVDRIPTTLSISETAPMLYGIDMCDYYHSVDAIVEVETKIADEFQADNMGVGLGLRTLAEAMGVKLRYPKKGVSYIDETAIRSLSEIDTLNFVNIEKDGRFPIIIQAIQRLQEKFSEERIIGCGLGGPVTTAASLVGTEKFLKATVKDRENVHKLLQFTTDCIVKCCDDLHRKLGINFSLAEPVGSRNILSKRQVNEFFIPYLSQTIERLNQFQGSTSIHICGRTRDCWSEIVSTGISGFSIDNCESLKELKESFGDQVSISGNLPPVSILMQGTSDEIEKGVLSCILDGADNPKGFTLCPGCTVPVGTPKENIIAFMNAATKYGRRAKKGCLPEVAKSFI